LQEIISEAPSGSSQISCFGENIEVFDADPPTWAIPTFRNNMTDSCEDLESETGRASSVSSAMSLQALADQSQISTILEVKKCIATFKF
jgi:hypothetical protein